MLANIESNEIYINPLLPIELSLTVLKEILMEHGICGESMNKDVTNVCKYLVNRIENDIDQAIVLNRISTKGDLKDQCTDAQVKEYLFNIVSPSKLKSLRNWITLERNKRASELRAFNVAVILHPYRLSAGENNIRFRLDTFLNEYTEETESGIDLKKYLHILRSHIDSVRDNGYANQDFHRGILSVIDILWLQIYYSNSFRLFKHVGDEKVDIIKEYLFSLLSDKELCVLKMFLGGLDLVDKQLGHRYGLVTSIYIADS